MLKNSNDDMVPRPLLKPSQVKVIPVRPEVPEVSLIFEPCSSNSQINSKEYQSDSHVRTIMSNYPLDKQYEDVLIRNNVQTPSNVSEALCFTPSNQRQNETRHIQKKVSFSPHPDNHDYLHSSPQINNITDCSKYSYQRDSSNCNCKTYETNNQSNDLRFISKYSDFLLNTPRLGCISERFAENDVYSKKPCACAWCADAVKHNSCIRRAKEQKFVSAEELESTVLKFENLFLNLNYKLSQIMENFVSNEEFNSLRQKYEDRLRYMQENIDKLTEESKKINKLKCKCKSDNEKARTEKLDNNTLTLHYTKPYGINGCSSSSINHNVGDIRHENNSKSTKKYTSDLMNECGIKCINNKPPHEMAPVVYTDDSSFSVQTCNSDKQKRKPVPTEQITNDQNRTSSTSTDAQLKQMYCDIVLQVKGMIDRERLLQTNETINPMHLIKKATLEQFRKMGINVEIINDEENHSSQTDVDTIPRKLVDVTNSAPSSDLSLHMNALAMKYISDGQSESEFQIKKSSANDVSTNCNNISIATLQYLERYQLLPTSDKTINNNKYERGTADQQDKFYEQFQSNDRSFIR